MRIKLKLSRKISFALIAGVSLIGLGGVTAAQLITVNNNISLNMGAGETNTAACDRDIRISGTQYSTGAYTNPYQRYGNFVITDIDLRAEPLGCGGQLLQMVVIDDTNSIQRASWTLPTRSDYATISFTFGTTNLRTYVLSGSSGTYNASIALASVGIMDMKQIAIGISKS